MIPRIHEGINNVTLKKLEKYFFCSTTKSQCGQYAETKFSELTKEIEYLIACILLS